MYQKREEVPSRENRGLLFADDFVGMSATPGELQKQIDTEMEFARKYRRSARSRSVP